MNLKCACGKDIQVDDNEYTPTLKGYNYDCSNGAVMVAISNTNHINIAALILNLKDGELPDHINGDIHNNLLSNLRVANRSQNAANSKLYSNNSSGYRGVFFDNKSLRWRRQIRVNGRSYTKLFSKVEDAAKDYDKEARKHFGEFARLNFPNEGERSAL